jgi:hypothetical protein
MGGRRSAISLNKDRRVVRFELIGPASWHQHC